MIPKSSQAGFSLVEILVAVGLLGLIAFQISSLISSHEAVQRVLFAKRSFADVDEALRISILQSFIHDHVAAPNGCTNRPLPLNVARPIIGLDQATMMLSSRHPNQRDVPNLPAQAPAAVRAAAHRCRSVPFRSPGPNSDFYFCVLIDGKTHDQLRSEAAKKSSFMRSDYRFAEVQLSFRNLATDAPGTCTQFKNRLIGAVMSMAIYWGAKAPPSQVAVEDGGFHVLRRIFNVAPR